jgi:hypothetical protein
VIVSSAIFFIPLFVLHDHGGIAEPSLHQFFDCKVLLGIDPKPDLSPAFQNRVKPWIGVETGFLGSAEA